MANSEQTFKDGDEQLKEAEAEGTNEKDSTETDAENVDTVKEELVDDLVDEEFLKEQEASLSEDQLNVSCYLQLKY